MSATLAALLTPQTQTQIFANLLGVYQSNGFPVQSWQTGGVERTRLMAFSKALADVVGNYIPAAAGGGFLDYASTNWMRLTAQELYNIVYNAASQTQGSVTATVASGSGPYTYTPGSLTAVFGSSLNRYLNLGSGTLGAGPSTTVLTFQAEFSGAKYNDPSNSGALTLSSPSLPGVTLTNPAGTYSSVAHIGSGTGTLTLAGSPTAPHQVIIRIASTGAAASVAWYYSIDGAPFSTTAIVGNVTNLGGANINITFVDGSSGTSFVTSDTYTFAAPGSWISVQGSDDESLTALAQRCRNRWASLSSIPVNSLYQLLATSTPSVGSQVTQAIVLPDSIVNNQVNIVVAGPSGVLPPATIALIQAWVAPRVPITDKPLVVSPTTLNVTLAGTITVSASQLAAAQSSIQVAMTNYIAAVGINGIVRLSAVVELLMQVSGVVDVSNVTINGAATNLTLGSSSTFVLPLLQPLTFTYVTQ